MGFDVPNPTPIGYGGSAHVGPDALIWAAERSSAM